MDVNNNRTTEEGNCGYHLPNMAPAESISTDVVQRSSVSTDEIAWLLPHTRRVKRDLTDEKFWVSNVIVVGDVSVFNAWWHHQTETFSALLAICAGN